MTTHMDWYQQGDVAVKPSGFPVDLKDAGTNVLVASAVTSHTHAVHGAVKVLTDGTTKYIDAAEPFELRHPEHRTLTIPAGQYRVDAIREFDHFSEEARAVAD